MERQILPNLHLPTSRVDLACWLLGRTREMKIIPTTYSELIKVLKSEADPRGNSESYYERLNRPIFEKLLFSDDRFLIGICEELHIKFSGKNDLISKLLNDPKLLLFVEQLPFHRNDYFTFKEIYSQILPMGGAREKRTVIPKLRKSSLRDINSRFADLSINKDIMNGFNIISYDEMKVKVREGDFLKSYHQALQSLYEEKANIYKGMIEEIGGRISKNEILLVRGGLKEENLDYDENMKLDGHLREICMKLSKIPMKDEIARRLLLIFESETLGLEGVIGREDIKQDLAKFLFAFSRNWRTALGYLNIALLGGPGTGKSLIVKVIAHFFEQSGMMVEGKLNILNKTLLSPEGNSSNAAVIRKILISSIENVLFIDEIYLILSNMESLGIGGDMTNEIVVEISDFLDRFMGRTAVILAGNVKKMKCFFGGNDGMNRRFWRIFDIGNYRLDDLVMILLNILEGQFEIKISQKLADFSYSLLKPHFPAEFSHLCGDMLELASIINLYIHTCVSDDWGNDHGMLRIMIFSVETFLKEKERKRRNMTV